MKRRDFLRSSFSVGVAAMLLPPGAYSLVEMRTPKIVQLTDGWELSISMDGGVRTATLNIDAEINPVFSYDWCAKQLKSPQKIPVVLNHREYQLSGEFWVSQAGGGNGRITHLEMESAGRLKIKFND